MIIVEVLPPPSLSLSGNISGYLIDKQYPRALQNRECRLVFVGNRGTIALKRLIKASATIYHAALPVDRNEGLFKRDDFQPLSYDKKITYTVHNIVLILQLDGVYKTI